MVSSSFFTRVASQRVRNATERARNAIRSRSQWYLIALACNQWNSYVTRSVSNECETPNTRLSHDVPKPHFENDCVELHCTKVVLKSTVAFTSLIRYPVTRIDQAHAAAPQPANEQILDLRVTTLHMQQRIECG